jgi:hypothetical protein
MKPVGTVMRGRYAGQAYRFICCSDFNECWAKVELGDESGIVFRDVRIECLEE